MMMKKIAWSVVCALSLAALTLWFNALGYLGRELGPGEITAAAVPASAIAARSDPQALYVPAPATEASGEKQILFGDLHVHTSYSFDAYLSSLPLGVGLGVSPPADACDFARFCSALDFWSINDHAESLTPRTWKDTVTSIRQCNDVSATQQIPDTVAFLGWEWSQGGDQPTTTYGHKNVVLRDLEAERIPSRPISSTAYYPLFHFVSTAQRAMLPLTGNFSKYADFSTFMAEASSVPACPDGVDVHALPDSCREVATTPAQLFEKLDQWGVESLVIPHGLAWGWTNAKGSDLRYQLGQHDPRRERLLEVYSGHGNSELYRPFDEAAAPSTCPEPTDDFEACCWRAGEIVRARCGEVDAQECERRVEDARRYFLEVSDRRSFGAVAGAEPDDWAQCGQLTDAFMPASDYRPRMSAQYALAIGEGDDATSLQRYRLGLIGSSDNHKARPGTGYKELARLYMSDSKETGKASKPERKEPLPRRVVEDSLIKAYTRTSPAGSFFYSGGLVAVHSDGRSREAIWNALQRREVYATSGDRILLWFDMLNGPHGAVGMGAEVNVSDSPRFRARALGAFEQLPGCPQHASDALGAERIGQLCRDECFNPGSRRKALNRLEVVRIRPQTSAEQDIASLIDDPWKVFDCSGQPDGCVAEFEDEEFGTHARETLYYVRAIQDASPAINGDPFHCERDAGGACIRTRYCVGETATRDNDCLAPAEERAWSSPIFVGYRTPGA